MNRPEHGRRTRTERPVGASQEDFAAFYDATWRRTVACAYPVLGDLGSAEEAVQEAYPRAWPRWSKLASYDDPGAWVRQVATRQAISGWRRRRTARKYLATTGPPESASPPDENTVALVAVHVRRRLLPVDARWPAGWLHRVRQRP
jgi:RNA polymerase sigma-70 factor (ECF subfamily)